MNCKVLLSVLFAFVFCSRIQAGTVSVETAEAVALNFFKLNGYSAFEKEGTAIELEYVRTEADNTVDFYVFDLKPLGFIIITGDDNLEPVIAYSSESNFHSDVNHVGIKDWMDNAAAKINYAYRQQARADERISHLWASYLHGKNPNDEKNIAVSPLLTTTWGQDPYYNQLCPFNSTDNQLCVAGCIATAMAQIMKFWNFPPVGTGSYSYNDSKPAFSNNYGQLSANFGATTYNWTQMPAAITANNTAIATLMYQCGVSVAMDYGDTKQGGSGAYLLQSEAGAGLPCGQNSYSKYFSYNSGTLRGVLESAYSATAWTDLLKGELNAGRPIQYEGQDPGVGGHSWVCDGYDVNGLFHMNWGWGGYDNGYFSLSGLSVAGVNFSSNEGALIGIQPGIYQAPCDVAAGLALGNIAATSAVLNWTPVTGATKYNLQYRAVSSNNWVTVSGVATSSYTLASLAQCTAYQFQVQTVCNGGSSAYSSPVSFTTIGCAQNYCASSATDVSHEYIKSVKFGSLSHTSSDGKGYNSFTNISTSLEQGSYDTITLTPGFTSSTYMEYWTVYIDYNNNGSFTDTGELVVKVSGTGPVTTAFHVPAGSTTGSTRLRIQMQQGAYQTNPCSTFTYGEVQDFTINITTSSVGHYGTGEHNIAFTNFRLYPNPAAGHITVEYEGMNDGLVNFNIYNLAGQKIMSAENTAVQGLNVHQLVIDRLNNGIYIMEIECNGDLIRQKFIVTK